jgi:serine phosphatase RsbU (regulator of sigma subunit)
VNSFGLFTIVGIIIFYYISINRNLYIKQQETNKQLYQSNEELNTTLEIVNQQKEQIETQHKIVVDQNEHITDSINYAKRIQQAVLPSQDFLCKTDLNHFILFKPRDIVSGDFYWFKKIREFLVFSAVDCTGHGVPGAFMSMLGVAFLNEIILRKDVVKSSQVLELLRDKVKSALSQTGRIEEPMDGMDMAFCIINTKTNVLQYSGANNPLFIIRPSGHFRERNFPKFETMPDEKGPALVQINADPQPIGWYIDEKPFTNHDIRLEPRDRIYLFSDGFEDQAGGGKGKKFMRKKLKHLLLDIAEKPMSEQKQILEARFEDWKGTGYEQTDDVLIIGLEIAECEADNTDKN